MRQDATSACLGATSCIVACGLAHGPPRLGFQETCAEHAGSWNTFGLKIEKQAGAAHEFAVLPKAHDCGNSSPLDGGQLLWEQPRVTVGGNRIPAKFNDRGPRIAKQAAIRLTAD